jgi:signal transduction histidine kinase
MPRALSRLRWQLTLSHLLAIAFTLVSMIAALLLISSAWLARNDSPSSQPADDARVVASAVQGLVVHGLAGPDAGGAELSQVLRLIADGEVRLLSGPGAAAPDAARRFAPFGAPLSDVAYLAVFGPDGRLLGSSDSAGVAFAPAEQREWTPLVDAALAGGRDPARLVARRTGAGPTLLGAYPIVDDGGRVVAAALVASTAPLPAASTGFGDFWRTLAFFSAATVAVLAGAFVFALASSSLVGYLLARRLVARLERLGRVAEALAGGDLSRRVDLDDDSRSGDEVNLLARRFNHMADQLAETVAALALAKQNAEEALRAKRELVANVSHELRTPLASIRGHVESLQLRETNLEPAARRTYLDIVHRETEQLSRLIDDLFELSTAESGGLPLSLQPVAVGEVADEVVDSIASVAQRERRVTVIKAVDAGLPPVLADRQRVAQVLSNLVRNAVRHTPEGGLVAVRASLGDGHTVTVSVEDTGVGISPEHLPHVFARFYRADASRDRASGGAGLGLAIVREWVEAMGGEVSAESTLGRGSRFSFTLAVANAALVSTASP